MRWLFSCRPLLLTSAAGFSLTVLASALLGCDGDTNGSLGGAASGVGASSGGGSGGTGGTGGWTLSTGGSSGGGGQPGCSDPVATIRDFQQAHPDFETFTGQAPYPGIVEAQLGTDGKPVYAHAGATQQTTGPGEFAQWYNDVPGVNQAFAITLTLTEVSPGSYRYENLAFFPIDGQGWGNEGNPHNFHFTTEIHTTFTYHGGEVFSFTGDDDLWLFVNERLALDLGGTHPPESGTVDFDAQASALGITVGNTYPMDAFHAERHTVESNFTVQTNIECFMPPPR